MMTFVDKARQRGVLSRINGLVKGYNFINVISFMLLEDYVESDDYKPKHCYDRLCESELFLLIGLWLKNIRCVDVIKDEEDLFAVAGKVRCLLDELHSTFLPSPQKVVDLCSLCSDDKSPLLQDEAMVQESIFYGDGGAYDLQFIQFINHKYSNDRSWILENKGVDIYDFGKFFIDIKKLSLKKVNEFYRDIIRTRGNTKYSINYPFTFRISDIININGSYMDVLEAFACDVRDVKSDVKSLDDFNPIVETPIVKINDEEVYIPYLQQVARSLYEVPFYWISQDKDYYERVGKHNRGQAGEIITEGLLLRIFPSTRVFRNVVIKHKKQVRSEIDVLVVHDELAFVFQVKSKRLSMDSYKGKREAIACDYEKAIGKAYKQACLSETEILDHTNEVIALSNESVDVRGVREIIKVGITLDFFPAVETITRRGLGNSAQFISMSVFDLDMLCKYIKDENDFVQYFRSRVYNRKHVCASNEATYFGYYLKHGSFPCLKGCSRIMLPNEYGDEIEPIMYKDLVEEFYPDVLSEEISANELLYTEMQYN